MNYELFTELKSIKPTWHYTKDELPKEGEEVFCDTGDFFGYQTLTYDYGDCVGFNSDCALSVMTSNGNFAYIIDNREAGIKFKRDLYYSNNTNEIIESNKNIVKEFKSFIKKVYT